MAPRERRGLLLVVEDEAGGVGLGEAAPLPQLSPDTLEHAQGSLCRIDWQSVEVPTTIEDLGASYPRARGDGQAPAARFAFETALASLSASARAEPLHQWLRSAEGWTALPVQRSIYVGATDDAATMARAQARVAGGARGIKVKRAPGMSIGVTDLYLGVLRAAIGAQVSLRVDENGRLSLEEAAEAAKVYARHGVELLEEPCGPLDMLRLGPLAVPWFADECLAEPTARGLVMNGAAAGVVIKPTVLGGLRASLDLADQARAVGKAAIVTHTFEGPVALAACAELALALGPGPFAHGLDMHAAVSAFSAWPVRAVSGHPSRVEPTPLRGLGLGAPSLDGLEEVFRWSR